MRFKGKDSIAENRTRAQKCRTQSDARVAICRAGSSSTLGHASLARRRLVFDCFQGLQNFLPARGAGLSGVAFTQAWRLETESRKGWGNRVCEEPTRPT